MNEASNIRQEKWQNRIIHELENEPWIPVYYLSDHNQRENIAIFSAIVPSPIVTKLLDDYGWDVTFDFGKPNISQSFPEEEVIYSKYLGNKGIEPVIIPQNFYGLHEKQLNLSEEFRLFHNLFWNCENNTYQNISLEDGGEEDVVRIFDCSIEINNKYIKQFCAFKKMHLAIYFDIKYFSRFSLSDIGVGDEPIEKKGVDYHFTIYWDDYCGFDPAYKSFSRLFGKKYIKPMLLEETGIWPYEKQKDYEEFIIDTDNNGKPILFTCNPEKLADYYGKNPSSPHYLTPVFLEEKCCRSIMDFLKNTRFKMVI